MRVRGRRHSVELKPGDAGHVEAALRSLPGAVLVDLDA
jgi:hypothetical protein